MSIKATIRIDDDRWAKHPFGVEFDDDECNKKYKRNGLNGWDECYHIIDIAKRAGYDIDENVNTIYY